MGILPYKQVSGKRVIVILFPDKSSLKQNSAYSLLYFKEYLIYLDYMETGGQ
jgi:hypothetical protein